MIGLAFVGRFTVDLNRTWDEFDVRNVALVRFINVTNDQVLNLNCLLLLALVFIITI